MHHSLTVVFPHKHTTFLIEHIMFIREKLFYEIYTTCLYAKSFTQSLLQTIHVWRYPDEKQKDTKQAFIHEQTLVLLYALPHS